MHRAIFRWLRVAACALALGAGASHAVSIPGEPSLTAKQATAPAQLHLAPSDALQVRLSPVADSELQRLRNANAHAEKRLRVGIVRSADATSVLPRGRDVPWREVPGGYAAQVAVTSPEAGAMRLALDLAGVAPQVEVVVQGSADSRLVGPTRVGDIGDRGVPWWTPVTDGDTQTVELFAPRGTDRAALALRVVGASHLFTTIASRFEKRTQEIGDAGSCNVDIKCSSLQSSQPFLDARNAVAQMVFTEGGFVGLCTGTMLNDTDPSTQIPYFYSANHCFENENLPFKTAAQMQAVANTLNTLWFFEAVSCGSLTVPPFVQLANGAAFLYNNPGADVLFLRLNDAAPAGSFFAGWDSNAISVGASIVVIHHPSGDLKKVSQGTVRDFSSPPVLGGATAPFSEVVYNSGTTEAGSSGSGIFTFDGSQYVLRGGLWGGSALCSNPTGTDNFSRFDQVYGALAPYLSPANAPAFNYSDMWFNPSESGWGIDVIQHPSHVIFAVWFTYDTDGNRTWYVLPSGSWSSPNTYSGTLYQTSGPPANAGTFNAASVRVTAVGTGTLTFSDANNGTWTYIVNGASGTKAITRQTF